MPPTSKRRRRANVTPEEKAALLAVCHEIRDEEPKLSVRAYMYRIWARQDVYLLGELCSKAAGEGQDPNEEPIQRLLLEFRRKGLIPYESIIDGTRPTTFAEGGYDHIDQARERMAEARQNVVEYYSLNIWTPQGKRAEMLSEKEALAIIVGRVTRQYGVNLTSSKGFSSESNSTRFAERTALSGMPTTFLILTDHDRAGYNMCEHVERVITGDVENEERYPGLIEIACQEYGLEVPTLEFVRIGLSAEQADRYDVMTRDPKPSEHDGMRNYVANPAEVDALRSNQIEEIVREGIEAQLDMALLVATREQEAADIATLREELEEES